MTPTGRKDRHPDDTYLQQAAENDARLQPDPELALSGGKANGMQKWAVALGAAFIAGLVLYGLSQPHDESRTAAAPPTAETTGAAPSAQQAAPEQPAQQPAKPGPADSAR